MQQFRDEEESTDTINGKKIIRKPLTQNEEQRKVATIPRYSADGRTTKYTELLRWLTYLDYLTTIDIKHEAPHRQKIS